MQFLIVLTCLLLSNFAVSSQVGPNNVGITPLDVIESYGYVGETHYITTEDGYILTFYRIPHGINSTQSQPKPPVLLMHGYSCTSADYLVMGPKMSLGFILADAGYDVWLANARGSTFSRNHTTLDPIADGAKFYNFTWDEIGHYDIKSGVDYILEVNGDDSLYYIGSSQGSTTFLTFASTRLEYNSKIRLASLMAPAAILKHYPSSFIQELCQHISEVAALLNKYNLYDIPFVEEIRNYFSDLCKDPDSNPTCEVLYEMLFSGDGGQIPKEYMSKIGAFNPANAGLKQYVHYGQQVKNGGFSKFDYGPEKNMEIYGTENPPPYNLSAISTPIAFYYAENDGLIAVEDELTLVKMVPNVVINYLVPYPLFRHVNFVFAKDGVELVYNTLMAVMERY